MLYALSRATLIGPRKGGGEQGSVVLAPASSAGKQAARIAMSSTSARPWLQTSLTNDGRAGSAERDVMTSPI